MSTRQARGEARQGFGRGGELEWPSDSQGSHSRVTKMGWAKVKPPTHVWRERRLCEAAAGVAAERATVERETCGAPPTQMSATRHLTLSPTRKRSVSELTNLLAPSHSRSSPWETTWTCVGARKYSSDTYPRDFAVNNSREGSEAYGGGFEPPPKPPDARGEGGSCTLPSLVVAMCLCITSILARAAMTPSIVVKGITAAIVTRLGCCSPPECRHPPTPSSRSTAGERSRARWQATRYDAYHENRRVAGYYP